MIFRFSVENPRACVFCGRENTEKAENPFPLFHNVRKGSHGGRSVEKFRLFSGRHADSETVSEPRVHAVLTRLFRARSFASGDACSIEKRKKFQKKMVDYKNDPVDYPQGFPQDVENCGKDLINPAEKPRVPSVKVPKIMKHCRSPFISQFCLFFSDFSISLTVNANEVSESILRSTVVQDAMTVVWSRLKMRPMLGCEMSVILRMR